MRIGIRGYGGKGRRFCYNKNLTNHLLIIPFPKSNHSADIP